MQDEVKIILVAVALFVAACWVFYKERIVKTMSDDIEAFAMEDPDDKE